MPNLKRKSGAGKYGSTKQRKQSDKEGSKDCLFSSVLKKSKVNLDKKGNKSDVETSLVTKNIKEEILSSNFDLQTFIENTEKYFDIDDDVFISMLLPTSVETFDYLSQSVSPLQVCQVFFFIKVLSTINNCLLMLRYFLY